MLTFLTAGESHGRGVFALLDGVPAGLRVDRALIEADLVRRQGGYGRGGRMQIERDSVDVLSGLRGGLTLGGPLLLAVWNRDFENWKDYLDPWEIKPGRELHTPRPGHADLAGAVRFHHSDLRNVLERASARETAGRVAAGGLLRSLLRYLGVEVYAWVTAIGQAGYQGGFDRQARERSGVFCPDEEASRAMQACIDEALSAGDTLGGGFTVVVEGLPAGIGSCTQWDRRLDAALSAALMSIPGIKAVQTGQGVACEHIPGSEFHDELRATRPVSRASNRAGGLEGGMSNGEPVVLLCSMKPIPTLKQGLASIDLRTHAPVRAAYERSDCCAVPAASVVGEAMALIAVATSVLESFPCANMEDLEAAFARQRAWGEAL